MIRQCEHVRNQRGVAMVYVGMAMVAILALTAAGIGLAHLAFTAVEVQEAAEEAATAGATALLKPGGSSTTAAAAADAVLAKNTINGVAANASPNGVTLQELKLNGSATDNAVKATEVTTATNLLGSVFGTSTSIVTKTAVATFTGAGSGQADLPLALCNQQFTNPNCFSDSCLPQNATTAGNTSTACWTSFEECPSNQTNIENFITSGCGQGTETSVETVNSSETICTTNGAGPNEYAGVYCMACQLSPQRCTSTAPCSVPVVDCSTCPSASTPKPVLGFAKIVISGFLCVGEGSKSCTSNSDCNGQNVCAAGYGVCAKACSGTCPGNRQCLGGYCQTPCDCSTNMNGKKVDSVTVSATFSDTATGSPGGQNFGAGFVQLVQ